MQSTNLNLLTALDALLEEESVAGAADRMQLSAPAMSRALARIRRAVGDPVLVRAGTRMVPTPRAIAMRARVRAASAEAQALLRPEGKFVLADLERTFTIRANDACLESFAARLLMSVRAEAPRVALRFVPEGDEDIAPLREGIVDLDIGPVNHLGPEVKIQSLFRDHFVGAVGNDHPLAKGKVTLERFVKYPHVAASRRGRIKNQLDDLMARSGVSRTVALVVPTFHAALEIAVPCGLVATVPQRMTEHLRILLGLHYFELPIGYGPLPISQAWHPRFDSDPSHRWLRARVKELCSQRES